MRLRIPTQRAVSPAARAAAAAETAASRVAEEAADTAADAQIVLRQAGERFDQTCRVIEVCTITLTVAALAFIVWEATR